MLKANVQCFVPFYVDDSEQERQYFHIGPNHLVEVCSRITGLLNKDLPPSIAGVATLLGAGQQSVLRAQKKNNQRKSLIDYCTRSHGMPLLDSNPSITHNIGECRTKNAPLGAKNDT